MVCSTQRSQTGQGSTPVVWLSLLTCPSLFSFADERAGGPGQIRRQWRWWSSSPVPLRRQPRLLRRACPAHSPWPSHAHPVVTARAQQLCRAEMSSSSTNSSFSLLSFCLALMHLKPWNGRAGRPPKSGGRGTFLEVRTERVGLSPGSLSPYSFPMMV